LLGKLNRVDFKLTWPALVTVVAPLVLVFVLESWGDMDFMLDLAVLMIRGGLLALDLVFELRGE